MSGAVLITRPARDSRPLQEELARRGWKSLVEPMIAIEPLPASLPALHDCQGLVFTSANGVRTFAELSGKRDLPVYTVGRVTAAAAQEAGFTEVQEGPGTLAGLTAQLQGLPELRGRRLLHLSGKHVMGTPAVSGVTIENFAIYQAIAAEHLSPACLDGLENRHFAAVLFFSARTAAIFTGLLQQYARTDAAASINALCIADSVVKSLDGVTWKDVQVAPMPEGESMLAMLGSP